MQKREALFQTQFNSFLRNEFKQTGVFELKHTRGKDSLPFSEVKEHQLNALRACKHGTFAFKISDIGMVFNPFDCFSMHHVPAFVVIKFPAAFYMIDVDAFIEERNSSVRKSLTEVRAKAIAFLSR